MKRRIGTISGFVIALLFVCIGVIKGQHIDVLNKAIKICLECVGIG